MLPHPISIFIVFKATFFSLGAYILEYISLIENK